MVKRLASKKGIFFTAMLVMMSATLLTLSVLLFNHSLESEKRFVELSRLDNVHNLYSSIENSIIKIVSIESERTYWDFNYQEDYIEFDWNLTPEEVSIIKSSLTDFSYFIQSEYSDFYPRQDIKTTIVDFDSLSITMNIDVNLVEMGVRKKFGVKIT